MLRLTWFQHDRGYLYTDNTQYSVQSTFTSSSTYLLVLRPPSHVAQFPLCSWPADPLSAFFPWQQMKRKLSVFWRPNKICCVLEQLRISSLICPHTVFRVFVSASTFALYAFPISSHLFGHTPGASSDPSQHSGSVSHLRKLKPSQLSSITYRRDHR